MEAYTESSSVSVYNLKGVKILSIPYEQFWSTNMVVDVSGLDNGSYLICVDTPKVIYTEKFIKK